MLPRRVKALQARLLAATAAPNAYVSQARGADRFNRSEPSGPFALPSGWGTHRLRPVSTGARIATHRTVREEQRGARLHASADQALLVGGRTAADGANRLVETVGGDRERVHLAAPGQIETPPRRTRRDSAAVDGSSPPAAYPVSLKSHRRLLAAECRRRARRRTTRMGSSTRMRSATYAQSKPRQLQATRSRRRRQGQNINAGDDLS